MSNFEWVAVAVVSVLGTARLTRLVVWDKYPPSMWLRTKWDEVTNDGPWSVLVHCGYCFGMWAGLFTVLTGYLSDWHEVWWLFNGWLATSYLAATYLAFDGDDE